MIQNDEEFIYVHADGDFKRAKAHILREFLGTANSAILERVSDIQIAIGSNMDIFVWTSTLPPSFKKKVNLLNSGPQMSPKQEYIVPNQGLGRLVHLKRRRESKGMARVTGMICDLTQISENGEVVGTRRRKPS